MLERISHIGIMVENLDQAVDHWSRAFGLEVRSRAEIEVEGIKNAFLTPPGSAEGSFFIELIAPMEEGDTTHAIPRRFAESGEGIYHLAITVDDIAATGAALTEQGLRVVELPGIAKDRAGRLVVHPKSANGVLIEILQEGG